MLDDKDIQKLIEAQKEVFATKEEMKEMISNLVTKKDFNNLQTFVDAYAKKADAYFQEMVALSHKVNRHEKRLLQIADKLGIKLEY
jgi:acetone carboxylase gamma subunit